MPETTRLRLAAPADADLVAAISAAAYIPAYLPVIGAVPRPASEDYAPRIARGEVHLLERMDEVIGVLVLEPGLDHLVIYSIAVHPASQGEGFGKALLAHAERIARLCGHRTMRLYTNRRMTANLALYRGAGFVETGERAHPSRPGEMLVDLAKPVA
jgi:ribosomal protein S18 acetylase RimI-like enzyme